MIVIAVRSSTYSNAECFFLLIADDEGEFDQDVLSMGTNFRVEYESLIDACNSG